VSIPRLLHILALVIFVVFIATFFTVLVRLSRVGIMTERYARISGETIESEPSVITSFDLLGQDKETGQMKFNVRAQFDSRAKPFSELLPGDKIVLRVENLQAELWSLNDIQKGFSNPTSDRWVTIDFGDVPMDILDRRDFYPFDGYELSFNFSYYVPGNKALQTSGTWIDPKVVSLKSLTNLIFLSPRYAPILTDVWGFRTRVARLRMLQFLAATLILIELLFVIYLITIVDLQELLAKGLGYLVVLYIIRNILSSGAPQFPTLVDYGALFLVCVTFFIMLFKFFSGAEEHSLITVPSAWRAIFMPDKDSSESGSELDTQNQKTSRSEDES